jgi:small nuclear ribonucleoprotein
MSASPASLLDRLVSQKVELLLKDGRTLAGRLAGVDDHLNLVLDETEERKEAATRRLGRVVVRGSNVVSLSAASSVPAGKPH